MSNNLNKSDVCFELLNRRPTSKYQIFIFSEAGSPGSFYREWTKHLDKYDLFLIIYPGRLKRTSEKFFTTIKEYIIGFNQRLIPFINKPSIFIGHSIGTVINFALAQHMIETNNKRYLIKLLVEVGRGPPHLPDLLFILYKIYIYKSVDPDKSFADMNDAEIVESLKKMADPKTREVYDYPEFVEMLIPMLKADA
ncbi:unnamed protein product [Rotaria sp. Silwood1]|nr:unnamed protein product [Rotaria sp. Silwood1]CAF4839472.1 unnamed protein product [Rotaria sp. Silwood1]